MTSSLRARVEATWSGEAAPALRALLRAAALPYGAAVWARNLAYDAGWLPVRRVPARVVSIGNLVVGGSGKTPTVLWLAGRLAASGRSVAIVARGYKKRGRGVVVVSDGRALCVDAATGGDEAAVMARRFAGPVVTGADRVAAVRVAIERFGVDTVVLDDGFQHRRLARDVDLVVAGPPGPAPWLLPAGPYREPPAACARATALLTFDADWSPPIELPCFRARMVATSLVRPEGSTWTEEPLGVLAGRAVVAAAGIARPERFVAMLRALGAHVTRTELRPDHHPWPPADVAAVVARADSALVVTTEKDLVKWPAAPGAAVRALRIDVEVDDPAGLLRLAGGTSMVCEGYGGYGSPGGEA